MYVKVAIRRARILFGSTAICALFCAHLSAQDKSISDSMKVSAQGLDLSKPADARAFYLRLENAAWVVCTRGTRAGLLPVDNQYKCYQDAIGEAVRASNEPQVTQIYLATHTLQEAAAHGIALPGQVAAK
jgi:UrcA family protein